MVRGEVKPGRREESDERRTNASAVRRKALPFFGEYS